MSNHAPVPPTSEIIDTSAADGGFPFWIEHGFSRREIGARMLAADPELVLYMCPKQLTPGATGLAFPELEGATSDQVVDALNEVVAARGIKALWPQDTAQYDLSGVNATVHTAATPETRALLDDKLRFSEWLGAGDVYNSESTEAIGAEAVSKEYERRRAQGREVCLKPAIGVFGNGYWRLTPNADTHFLDSPSAREIHPDIYLAALAQREEQEGQQQRLIMMDWLPGPEVSIDLLCWKGIPLAHAARTKLDARHQQIQSEHPVVDHTRELAARLALHGIVSMQYRLDTNGDWKMLEINPRPAGGSTHSEDAGFGIITNWTKLVTGKAYPEDIKQHEGDALAEVQQVLHVTQA